MDKHGNFEVKRTEWLKWMSSRRACLIAAALGGLSFLIVYGFSVLNPGYTDWLFHGPDGDLTQHYLGWKFFREDAWHFPLGIMENIAWPNRVSIIFTDSIPIFAVFFKAFRFLLPESFQYFGWWGLLCFVLQGLLSAKILKRYMESDGAAVLGSLFFVFSPVLIDRMYWMTSLSAHWLCLLGIWFIVDRENLKKKRGRVVLSWTVLGVLCASIHLYFLPMCGILLIGFCFFELYETKKGFTALFSLVGYLLGAAVTVALLGGFSSHMDAASYGLGDYSFNLNGFFNPTARFAFWSGLLPARPQYIDNQYEGFAYLGVGVLLLLFVMVTQLVGNRLSEVREEVTGKRLEKRSTAVGKETVAEENPKETVGKETAVEVGPNGNDRKEAAVEVGPSGNDRKEAAVEVGPSGNDRKEAAVEVGPSGNDRKEAAVEVGPSGNDRKEAAVEVGPSGNDRKEAAVEVGPSGNDRKEVAGEIGPSGNGKKDAAGERGRKGEWIIWLLLFLLSVLAAASPVLTLNEKVLLNLPLPGFVRSLWEMFRASGRLIWPALYLLVLWALVGDRRFVRKEVKLVVLAACLFFQLYDMKETLVAKRVTYREKAVKEQVLTPSSWQALSKLDGIRHLVFTSDVVPDRRLLYAFGDAATEYGMTINDFYFARPMGEAVERERQAALAKGAEDTLFICYRNESQLCLSREMNYYALDGLIVGCVKPLSGLTKLTAQELSTYRFDFSGGQYVNNGEDIDGVRYLHSYGNSYGPYLKAEPGAYRVTVTGSGLTAASLQCHYAHGDRPLEIRNTQVTEEQIICEVWLEERAEDLEFLVWNTGAEDMALTGIEIVRMQ